MELHHVIPRSQGGTHDPSNLQEAWPWEHSAIDPFRHYNGPMPSGG
ncbi:HNH endonuclease [Mizugakiibacter sediminis]